MKTPDTLHLPSEEARPVPPHLRVGSVATRNVIDEAGVRRFLWTPTEEDQRVKQVAGWERFLDTTQTTADRGCLIVPVDTRAASAILSGMQAFPGEKDEVVSYIGRYAKAVYDETGAVDTALGLDTVGVTRGNKQIFALPPHAIQNDAEKMQAWAASIDQDLERVLAGEEQREHLMGLFVDATSFARGGA